MKEKRTCLLPGGELPVVAEADIIVAGGTVGGVAAAAAASQLGADVFVIGTMPYMGEDVCGTYRHLFERRTGDHPLLQQMFPDDRERAPFTVKKALEDVLIDHDIGFLYSSYVTEVLFDEGGGPAGVVIVNRTGRQVVRGSVIIDATDGAYVAKLAGVGFTSDRSEETEYLRFITVSGESVPNRESRRLPMDPKSGEIQYHAYEHTLRNAVKDYTFAELCAAEQAARSAVWDANQSDSADLPFFIPCSRIEGEEHCAGIPRTAGEYLLGSFVSRCNGRLFVLGAYADVDRAAAVEILRPDIQVSLGERIAKECVRRAKDADRCACPVVRQREAGEPRGVISVWQPPLRPSSRRGMLKIGETLVPVIDEYPVVVAGGGTAGANAAIGAARSGVRTLVIEALHGLGGTQTLGRIGVYWDGFREGFTAEIDRGVNGMGGENHPRRSRVRENGYLADWKMEWYRRQILDAGGEIWFGAFVCGALVEDGRVYGVLIAMPGGLGVVLAQTVVDATGSGDVAIAAGAQYEYTDGRSAAVQGAGLPPVNPGDYYNNTDWTFTDDSDMFDVTRLFVTGKVMFDGAYDIGKLPQTRERRRIVGDHTVTVQDVVNDRRYRDTISFHRSSFDTHGFTVDPYFTLLPPPPSHVLYEADMPLRALLPRGLDNILVTGLGASAHRDAMPVMRMQPCLQNQGYSVGVLCARAVRENTGVRGADIRAVQAILVEKGILPARVLSDTDSPPFSDEEIRYAVLKLPGEPENLRVVMSDTKRTEKFLLEAYGDTAEQKEKALYGQVLCMLGNAAGLRETAESVRSFSQWDEGWNYTGMGQFGPCMSRLDSLVIALGATGREEALEAVLEKAALLTPAHAFSHFRAVSLACESIASPAAAPALSRLLDMEGLTGHHVTTLQEARERAVPNKTDVTLRNLALRELHIARALYRCGDNGDRGRRILLLYCGDLHGPYYRHAAGVLGI